MYSLFNYQVSVNNYSEENGEPVAEYTYATAVNNSGETMLSRSYVLGYKLESYDLLAISDQNYFYKSKQFYSLNFGAIQMKQDNWAYLVGAGSMNSSHVDPAAIVILKIKYTLLPSINQF